LQASDKRQLRFAALGDRGTSTFANLRNLSETGLSFTVDVADAPEEGDVIKAEFTVPGQKQFACFALVTRVELETGSDPEWGDRSRANVAVHFHDLSPAAVRLIQKGLDGKAAQHEDSGDIMLMQERAETRRRQALLAASVVALILLGIALLTLF
jgi:hypothetical protein